MVRTAVVGALKVRNRLGITFQLLADMSEAKIRPEKEEEEE